MESENLHSGKLNTVRLAEWINAEPVIFLGCTSSELSGVAIGSVLLCLPLFGSLGWAAGNLPLAIGAGALGALLCACATVFALRRLKDGKPAHYCRLCLMTMLARLGWHRTLVVRSGRWGLGRSR